jgi:hypothetical protein
VFPSIQGFAKNAHRVGVRTHGIGHIRNSRDRRAIAIRRVDTEVVGVVVAVERDFLIGGECAERLAGGVEDPEIAAAGIGGIVVGDAGDRAAGDRDRIDSLFEGGALESRARNVTMPFLRIGEESKKRSEKLPVPPGTAVLRSTSLVVVPSTRLCDQMV